MKPHPRKGRRKPKPKDWLGKKKSKRQYAIEHPPDTSGYDWIGHFDGSCSNNPGGTCAIGIILLDKHGEVVAELSKEIGGGPGWSNNCSEHSSAAHLFEAILKHAKSGDKVLVQGDSNLAVQQLNGKWKVKSGMYVEFYREAAQSLRKLRCAGIDVTIKWIPRELNELADALSKGA